MWQTQTFITKHRSVMFYCQKCIQTRCIYFFYSIASWKMLMCMYTTTLCLLRKLSKSSLIEFMSEHLVAGSVSSLNISHVEAFTLHVYNNVLNLRSRTTTQYVYYNIDLLRLLAFATSAIRRDYCVLLLHLLKCMYIILFVKKYENLIIKWVLPVEKHAEGVVSKLNR